MNTQILTQTQVIDHAFFLAIANEGTTYDVNIDAPVVANGPTYVVGLMTNASAIFDLSDNNNIAKHILSYWSTFAQNYLGLWVNDGKLYIDVAVVTHDKEYAISLGKAHNQISIFDLANFETIDTGGTGELA